MSEQADRTAGKKHGLGRGLGALIPGVEPRAGLLEVAIGEIAVNPRQPRHAMEEEALHDLADSIRAHGILQPLIVSQKQPPVAGAAQYQLIAGERRWRAAMLAGLRTVPVVVKEVTPQQTLELALVENLQRADLNALEEAQAYQQLVDDFGLTQEQVAERVGRSRVTVTNSLRLLRLPEQVRQALENGLISGGHARALLGLATAPLQVRVLQVVRKQDLSVRQTEELVRRLSSPPDAPKKPAGVQDADTRVLEDRFRASLGTKVSLFRSKRGGRLVVYFFSEEELEGLFDRIVGEQL